MSFAMSVIYLALNSSVACIISAIISSGPQALFCFSFYMTFSTSSCKIRGPSMSFDIPGSSPLSSSKSSSMYSVHLSSMSCFVIRISPFLALIHELLTQYNLLLDISLISLCILFVSVTFIISISSHFLFNHSSFSKCIEFLSLC